MRWTAEAIENLIRLALEGRSASFIAAALGAASRNAVIGKASRIGVKLNGDGRASVRGGTPARAYRAPLAAVPHKPVPGRQSFAPALSRDPRVIPGSQPGDSGCEEGRMELCRGGGWRDAAGEVRGHSRIGLPMAPRRSGERGFRLLRARVGQRALLLRRPLPDGLSPAGGGRQSPTALVPRARRSLTAALRALSSGAATSFRRTPASADERPLQVGSGGPVCAQEGGAPGWLGECDISVSLLPFPFAPVRRKAIGAILQAKFVRCPIQLNALKYFARRLAAQLSELILGRAAVSETTIPYA